MPINNLDRERALCKLQTISLALFDTVLFLDTHPNDIKALNYYKKYKHISDEIKRQYVEKYGPLSSDDVTITNYWAWINSPWPWE